MNEGERATPWSKPMNVRHLRLGASFVLFPPRRRVLRCSRRHTHQHPPTRTLWTSLFLFIFLPSLPHSAITAPRAMFLARVRCSSGSGVGGLARCGSPNLGWRAGAGCVPLSGRSRGGGSLGVWPEDSVHPLDPDPSELAQVFEEDEYTRISRTWRRTITAQGSALPPPGAQRATGEATGLADDAPILPQRLVDETGDSGAPIPAELRAELRRLYLATFRELARWPVRSEANFARRELYWLLARNRVLRDPEVVRRKRDELEARLMLARHYGTPFPRPSYLPTGTHPDQRAADLQAIPVYLSSYLDHMVGPQPGQGPVSPSPDGASVSGEPGLPPGILPPASSDSDDEALTRA